MEDYSDNWKDTRSSSRQSTPTRQSRRQTQRQRNLAQSRRTSGAISQSNVNSSVSEGLHRSFVARRFLEDEGDDLEPENLDLADDEHVNSDLASLGTSNASRGTGFFEKASKYNVDQSVCYFWVEKGQRFRINQPLTTCSFFSGESHGHERWSLRKQQE